ncbi:oxidoreductase [Amorphus orientalis]|uniref:2,4-dienoyl-CoA reductase-like NADH-dependent reductase (Old Yellow Enzyme family) n=1 Tax=Amorphus orientalis TaxID=649198 RepID=A0AAE4ARL3_9HYPH|nr:oxidoreductase [Amorphus orientalis]MDQ0313965.1 2,4-dienoyl-CoA reductase-like NADH-dependent reductase (Old Yellow Enzyme family) [Amorphus orientalis]
MTAPDVLFTPLTLPCGQVLKNRLVKAAMSDSLGDGRGNPTDPQIRLYERWAEGGAAAALVGEVQASPRFAEKPGNLVLAPGSDPDRFRALARRGTARGCRLWLQLGHAGAMAYPPISAAKGPSALDLPGLSCGALSSQEIAALPARFAATAELAKALGFSGVEVHAAHGFLLSQFLSPLFNRRDDDYGGSLENRSRLMMEVIDAVRTAVGPDYPVIVKLNATDQLEGGLEEDEALDVVAALDSRAVDLIDISGGTYFPGAKSASDRAGGGPYFADFARRARTRTRHPLMATGGFKTMEDAVEAIESGAVDAVGLARAFVLEPDLAEKWRSGRTGPPAFPRFRSPPEGGVTAWYTMRITELAEDREGRDPPDLDRALALYEERDRARAAIWTAHFGPPA